MYTITIGQFKVDFTWHVNKEKSWYMEVLYVVSGNSRSLVDIHIHASCPYIGFYVMDVDKHTLKVACKAAVGQYNINCTVIKTARLLLALKCCCIPTG